MINRDGIPWPVAEPIAGALPGGALVDATEMFSAVRQRADTADVRLAERAARIAAPARHWW